MQCVCVWDILYMVPIFWTNGGVLGSYCHINTWTAAQSSDSKHSSFINIQKKNVSSCYFCLSRVFRTLCECCATVCETKSCMSCFVMAVWCHSWATQVFFFFFTPQGYILITSELPTSRFEKLAVISLWQTRVCCEQHDFGWCKDLSFFHSLQFWIKSMHVS